MYILLACSDLIHGHWFWFVRLRFARPFSRPVVGSWQHNHNYVVLCLLGAGCQSNLVLGSDVTQATVLYVGLRACQTFH